MGNKENRLYRVVAFLKREELDFLDDLIKDIYFSYGVKIPRTKLIAEIIGLYNEKGIENKKELMNKILYKVRTRINRRRYPRLKKSLLVGFRKMDSLEEYQNCLSENICMGGLKVDVSSLDKPLAVHQPIELTIKNPEEAQQPIKAIGRVAWIREKENNPGAEIGIMLTYIRKEDRERFMQYLRKATDVKKEIRLDGGK